MADVGRLDRDIIQIAACGVKDIETLPAHIEDINPAAAVNSKPDGTVERHLLDDAGPGVGVPAILVDDAPKDPAAAQTWLSLASVSDATRLGALGPSGTLLDSLAAEPVVRSGELIALARGRMLLARPRGMAMELGLVECKPGPAPLKDAGAD